MRYNLICGNYNSRHNQIVNRLWESIEQNYHIIGEVQEKKSVKISGTEGINEKIFKISLRSDIWCWKR
jgi:transcription elongation factor Elf1